MKAFFLATLMLLLKKIGAALIFANFFSTAQQESS
jgi:hypothetical protein